jgi:glycosyltransferase involved in cell wall biosynthesis
MKILNVDMTLNAVLGGGTTERTCQMSRYLADTGCQCSILTTDCGLTQERVQNDLKGVEVIALPCLNRRFYIPFITRRRLDDIISQVDVIHLMGHWTLLNAMVYWSARRLGKPYVVCPAGALPIYGRSKIIKQLYNAIVGKCIMRNAARLIAVTHDEVKQFLAYGADERRIVVIPNGINESDYECVDDASFRSKFKLTGRPFILFVGRLNHIKGPDILLEAFSNVAEKLQKYDLVFAGPDSGMLQELQHIVRQQSLENKVHFLGFLGGKDKSMAYHAADLLVIPSRSEAMSIVVLEAGISGTPVLLTDQCGFQTGDTVDGIWTVPATVKGIQQGLMSILGNQDRSLNERGSVLKEFINKHYAWKALISRYIDLYADMLTSRIKVK